MKRLSLLTVSQAAAAALGLVCYAELLFTNLSQRPYAYPFSKAVWVLGSLFLLVTAALWIYTLVQQERGSRLKPALLSLGAAVPVFLLCIVLWPILWEVVSYLLPSWELFLNKFGSA